MANEGNLSPVKADAPGAAGTSQGSAGAAPVTGQAGSNADVDSLTKRLEAAEAARKAAEESYTNLRTPLDRTVSRLDRLEKLLTAAVTPRLVGGDEGEDGQEAGGVAQATAGSEDLQEIRALAEQARVDAAISNFFSTHPEAMNDREKILGIIRDENVAWKHAKYVRGSNGKLIIDYAASLGDVYNSLELERLRAAKAEAARAGAAGQNAENRAHAAGIGNMGASVEDAGQAGTVQQLIADLRAGKITPEDYLRKMVAAGLMQVDKEDLPEALRNPLI